MWFALPFVVLTLATPPRAGAGRVAASGPVGSHGSAGASVPLASAQERAPAQATPRPAGQIFLPLTVRPGLGAPARESLGVARFGAAFAADELGPTRLMTMGRSVVEWLPGSPGLAYEQPGVVFAMAADGATGLVATLRDEVRGGDSVLQLWSAGDTPTALLSELPLRLRAVDLRWGAPKQLYVAVTGPADGPPQPGLVAVDATDETRVFASGFVATAGPPNDLEVDGRGLLYVTSGAPLGPWDLETFGLDDPAAPTLMGVLAFDESTLDGRHMLAVALTAAPPADAHQGGVYVVGDGEVLDIDVANPAAPVLLGPLAPATPCLGSARDLAAPSLGTVRVQGRGCIEWRVKIAGNWEIDRSATFDRVYEVPDRGRGFLQRTELDQAHGTAGGLASWTDLPAPDEVDLPGTAVCLAPEPTGASRLLAVAGDSLWVLEVKKPAVADARVTLAPVGRVHLGFGAPGRCTIATHGSHAYVAADDLYAEVDLTDLEHPTSPGSTRVAGTTGGIAVDGHRAYLTAGQYGLIVRPIGNDPVQGGVMRTEGVARDVTWVDGTLYVADGPAGLTVYDATGEGLPQRVRNLPLEMDAHRLRWQDGRLFMTLTRSVDSHRWWLGDLAVAILAAEQPEKPELLGYLDVPGAVPGRPMKGPDGVLVPVGDALQVVDFTDPARARWVATMQAPAEDALAVAGLHLTALGDDGFGLSGP